MASNNVSVSTEIGNLKRLIIHSPDSGLGKVVPSKAQDWLFEDIVQLDFMRKNEYDFYVKILLYFLDKEKIKGKIKEIDNPKNNRAFYKPDNKDYHRSDKVLDTQILLADILSDNMLRRELVASISALERLTLSQQKELLLLNDIELAKTLISGSLPDRMIFAPIPNFIFTRDIGITINDTILMNKPSKPARLRESFLSKYIFYNHKLFKDTNIIELDDVPDYFLLDDDEKQLQKVTLEGGDIMMVAPNHLVVGISERTSVNAVSRLMQVVFEKEILEKVSVIKIPNKRDFMHIDTVFTQVKRNMWVIYGKFAHDNSSDYGLWLNKLNGKKQVKSPIEIYQFSAYDAKPEKFDYLEDLLDNISREDLKSSKKTQFIYSGQDKFPYSQREQWTDACNVLALKEGVVIGYDRNKFTAKAFEEKGFRVVDAVTLLDEFESGTSTPEKTENTLILLPSAELSRARGGSHCMSMPVLRDVFNIKSKML